MFTNVENTPKTRFHAFEASFGGFIRSNSLTNNILMTSLCRHPIISWEKKKAFSDKNAIYSNRKLLDPVSFLKFHRFLVTMYVIHIIH